jgi:hypothetical protein
LICALTLAPFAAVSSAVAQLIDFEQLPGGGAPGDNSAISTPYNLAGGGTVSFFFDTNGNNVFDAGVDYDATYEATGQDGVDAFTSDFVATSDVPVPASASQFGNYFLRGPNTAGIPDRLIVQYNTTQTITALSGEIWDIDGFTNVTERWRVDVLNSANTILATQLSPIGDTFALDAAPWTFSFVGLPAGADKVRIAFNGTKTTNIGYGFNNFDATLVPEPGASVLFAIGAVVVCLAPALRKFHVFIGGMVA